MTKINVIDVVDTEITRSGDPSDRWSRDSTLERHYIRGIEIGDKYGQLECSFDVKPNTYYYLLYYIYNTGDSFGSDDGKICFVGLYREEKLALKCANAMNKSAKEKNNQAQIWNEDGTPYNEYLSCVNDYFGGFNGAEVERVQLV